MLPLFREQDILQGRQLASSERLGFADIAARTATSEAGIAAQERIAASQITAFDREKATAAIAQIDATYQNAFSSIMANPDLPAEARNSALLHLAWTAPEAGRVAEPARWEPAYVRASSAERRVGGT